MRTINAEEKAFGLCSYETQEELKSTEGLLERWEKDGWHYVGCPVWNPITTYRRTVKEPIDLFLEKWKGKRIRLECWDESSWVKVDGLHSPSRFTGIDNNGTGGTWRIEPYWVEYQESLYTLRMEWTIISVEHAVI